MPKKAICRRSSATCLGVALPTLRPSPRRSRCAAALSACLSCGEVLSACDMRSTVLSHGGALLAFSVSERTDGAKPAFRASSRWLNCRCWRNSKTNAPKVWSCNLIFECIDARVSVDVGGEILATSYSCVAEMSMQLSGELPAWFCIDIATPTLY